VRPRGINQKYEIHKRAQARSRLAVARGMRHNRLIAMESSRARGVGEPRGKRSVGAAFALGGCAFLWLLGLLGTGDSYAIVWSAAGLLTCLVGLATVIGRICAYRDDWWQPALVTAFASVFAPLSAVLLVLPPVWRSLRDIPSQWRSRGEVAMLLPASDYEHTPDQALAQRRARGKTDPLRYTPDQAAAVHSRGASLALGLVAATLAFWIGAIISVWLAFASSSLTDGAGIMLTVFIALVVGTVSFVAVLTVRRRQRVLAGVEMAAASGMAAAIVCVALGGGNLHWDNGSRLSVDFLYPLWALVAILFPWGAAMARKRPLAVVTRSRRLSSRR
jgi:VIT1/CCC1 family predicted Fe2+/Mn2+ transporter